MAIMVIMATLPNVINSYIKLMKKVKIRKLLILMTFYNIFLHNKYLIKFTK